jgi:ParB/RepB/Spo0J family partition protein
MSRKSKTMPKVMSTETKRSKPLDPPIRHKRRDIEVRRVRVADVAIPDRWRSINENALASLIDSMSMIGLKMPITVRATSTGYRLVAGRHRLEVAKRLGWKWIVAIVTHAGKIDRQLWHEVENLDRVDLTALERAEAVVRRAKLAVKKAARGANSGGRQPNDKGISKAAKALGTSRDDVSRSKKMAAISVEAKEAAVEAGLADNGAALLKVAKEATTKAQVRKVHELANPKRASKPDLSVHERKQFKRLRRTFAAAVKFRQAWTRASKIVRDRFIARIRKLAPTG